MNDNTRLPTTPCATERLQSHRCVTATSAGAKPHPAASNQPTPSLDAKEPLKPVCDVCGSDDLVRDAAACWDVDAQAWVLLSTYDSTTCQACEREGDDICDWRSLAGTPAPESTAAN